jgi:uncharacterized protein
MVARPRSSIRPTIPPAAREFSEERLTIVVGFVDADGRVWTSLLAGEPGFVRAWTSRRWGFDDTPFPGDPVAQALQGVDTEVGATAIDFATRRRLNGEAEAHPDGIYVRIHQ